MKLDFDTEEACHKRIKMLADANITTVCISCMSECYLLDFGVTIGAG